MPPAAGRGTPSCALVNALATLHGGRGTFAFAKWGGIPRTAWHSSGRVLPASGPHAAPGQGLRIAPAQDIPVRGATWNRCGRWESGSCIAKSLRSRSLAGWNGIALSITPPRLMRTSRRAGALLRRRRRPSARPIGAQGSPGGAWGSQAKASGRMRSIMRGLVGLNLALRPVCGSRRPPRGPDGTPQCPFTRGSRPFAGDSQLCRQTPLRGESVRPRPPPPPGHAVSEPEEEIHALKPPGADVRAAASETAGSGSSTGVRSVSTTLFFDTRTAGCSPRCASPPHPERYVPPLTGPCIAAAGRTRGPWSWKVRRHADSPPHPTLQEAFRWGSGRRTCATDVHF